MGGGYHGKSTILDASPQVSIKVPGDGREFCATVDDAVTVRTEDGR
jgi:predicted ABC-class ATPase